MSLRTFRVEFDRPKIAYVAGETVAGKILLDNTGEIVTNGLYLSVNGKCQVFGLKSEEQTSNHSSANSEDHLSEKYDIVGSEKSRTRLTISAGEHEYPFNFTLPTCIPHSIEHKFGYIRYTAKAVLRTPWESDHETMCTFNVISHLDLNAFREKCPPIDEEIIDNLYDCCFLRKTPLAVRIRLPMSGYVPGQLIYITVDYNNSSKDTDIEKISVQLKREFTFHVSFLSGRKINDISKIKATELMGPLPKCGQSVLQLLVPDLPPSHLQYCKIMDLEYILVVTIHLSGSHFKVRKKYPMLIGTIPLYFNQESPTTMPILHSDSASTLPDDQLSTNATAPPDDQLSTNDTTPLMRNGLRMAYQRQDINFQVYNLSDHCRARKPTDIGFVLPPIASPPVTSPRNEVPDLQIEWVLYPILAFIYVVVPVVAVLRIASLFVAFMRMILF